MSAIPAGNDDAPGCVNFLERRVQALGAGHGMIVEAAHDLEEGLLLCREINDPRQLAHALGVIGGALQWRGDFARGVGCLEEAVEIAEREHDGHRLGLAAFFLGHAHASQGEYEQALAWYRRLADLASATGDPIFVARVPNIIGGVHLELFDADEAIQRCLEGHEVAQKVFPWPEPQGHSLVKVGLGHLMRGAHGMAEEFFGRAWALLDQDSWLRWRWHIPLLWARGALALAEGRHDEAWRYATQSVEMATRCDARKHIARARTLQGEILATGGRLDEAADALTAAVELAERLGTPREIWMGRAALGKVLGGLGRDQDAEAQFDQAARTIEALAARLTTPGLRRSFLGAGPVVDVFQTLGRRPPAA